MDATKHASPVFEGLLSVGYGLSSIFYAVCHSKPMQVPHAARPQQPDRCRVNIMIIVNIIVVMLNILEACIMNILN